MLALRTCFLFLCAASLCPQVLGFQPTSPSVCPSSSSSEMSTTRKMSASSADAATKSEKDGIMTGQQSWFQKTITVKAPSRGCHLITDQIYEQCPQIRRFAVGTAQIFITHTSASLTINENADPDVRSDMEKALNRIVPESWHNEIFDHVDEGPDDMTGHVKSTLIGASLNIPISSGRLALGTWQGIYLCEHRNSGGWGGGHQRKIVITLNGLLSG